MPSFRSAHLFPALRRRITAGSTPTFRVIHFSVLGNHVHLLVEAEDRRALSRGLQGLEIRLAKAINARIGRTGRVWSDRYHARALRTPCEVRRALVYVLLNARKHGLNRHGIDPCSSGRWFCGWERAIDVPSGRSPVATARTWLLRVGWCRSGRIGFDEMPAQRESHHPSRRVH